MPGFFVASELATNVVNSEGQAKCGACQLYKQCHTPKMKVHGDGRSKILIVAEQPSYQDDQLGRPLTGDGGALLRTELLKHGVSLAADCWITHAAICKGRERGSEDSRAKAKDPVNFCRPNLISTIKELKPNCILLMGQKGIASLIPYIWKADGNYSIERWKGWEIPSWKINSWVFPTYNPSLLAQQSESFRTRDSKKLELIQFRKHLLHLVRRAKKLEPPYEGCKDLKTEIQQIVTHVTKSSELCRTLNAMMAASLLRRKHKNGKFVGAIAIDYETMALKPDLDEVEILSMSISNGDLTIAFPMSLLKTGTELERRQARDILIRFFESDIPKIAGNIQFEHRWTLKKFGVSVKNWVWDTVLGAHWLDYREETTSVKFQSFVRLGVPEFEGKVASSIDASGDGSGNSMNSLAKEVRLEALLDYNGMDSYLEWHVAKSQIMETRQKGLSL